MEIKRSVPMGTALILMAGLLSLPGCGTRDTGTQEGSGAQGGGAAASAANTQVPNSTTIDGKTVPLKATPSGLRYYDIKVGTGPHPKAGQSVSVQYTGTLLDGTKFDSSYDHGGKPFEFAVGAGDVIPGWDEGVPGMQVGGKRRLVVPGALAYGANPPSPDIPPNATLVFDIELVGVK